MAKKTLLLGAGFSYELGMPLAKNLTDDFYGYLNTKRLDHLLTVLMHNQPYGPERPIEQKTFLEIKEMFLEASRKELNYENLMMELNQMSDSNKKQSEKDSFNYFNTVLTDIVSQLLWIHQEKKYDIYLKYRHLYELLNKYIDDQDVFIFTLNHDICLEMLCIDFKIPFSFETTDTIQFLQSNIGPQKPVRFLCQQRSKILSHKTTFINSKPNFNIVKLHGAFNEYGFNDENDLLFINHGSCENSVDYLNYVKIAWLRTEYIINGRNVKMSEFIPVTALDGEFKILSKSLLIGGKKYSLTINPKPGEEKLQLLEEVLKETEELTIFGYGFNDKYINTRIYNCMVLNPNLRIKRIDPIASRYPEPFDAVNYGQRLAGGICTTSEWLYYRVHEKWESDPTGEVKEFSKNRSRFEQEFRSRYFI